MVRRQGYDPGFTLLVSPPHSPDFLPRCDGLTSRFLCGHSISASPCQHPRFGLYHHLDLFLAIAPAISMENSSPDNSVHHVVSKGNGSMYEQDRKMQADLEKSKTHATYLGDDVVELSPAHREYLIARHGTDQLDPIPYPDDADPYNWPTWKKTTNLALVAIHAMMCTFNAAAIIPAYEDIAEEFGVTVPDASYLTAIQIAVLGCAPLFWRPMSNRFGRRPIFLFSLLAACICNIGCAESYSYATMMVCRGLVAFFISPAGAIGSAVVAETFFKRERAKYMGVWTLLITLGVPISPFLFGFLAQRVEYRWIYWVLAITSGVQFVLYIFLGPETRYLRLGGHHVGGTVKQEYFNFGRIDPTPFRAVEFVSPLRFFAYPSVFLPALVYSVVFLFGSIIVTVEIPQLFGEKFGFGPQALGLQFISVIIGSVIGEQIGGIMSDKWMASKTKKLGERPNHEYRLWLSYPGIIMALIGTVVFFVQLNNAPTGEWNVTPLVGATIAAVGNQIVTTVMTTYAVDCYLEDAAGVGVFIAFVRQMLGFVGPFW